MSSKNPIIFLDIDGVLNTAEHRKRQQRDAGTFNRANWCPVACYNVWWLCRHLDARIIVSSSWRHNHTLSQLKYIFRSNGIDAKYVIGVTPDVTKLDKVWADPTVEQKYCRGYEIEEWLLLNDPDCPYIIIDDADVPSELPLQKHKSRFIHVDSEVGFADFKAFNQSINLLSNECKQRT